MPHALEFVDRNAVDTAAGRYGSTPEAPVRHAAHRWSGRCSCDEWISRPRRTKAEVAKDHREHRRDAENRERTTRLGRRGDFRRGRNRSTWQPLTPREKWPEGLRPTPPGANVEA